MIDNTHDSARTSWIESANDSADDFPIQNLPFGVFRRKGTDDQPHIGVAIGDQVLDVNACIMLHQDDETDQPLLEDLPPETACALCATNLNALMKHGQASWQAARKSIGNLLDANTPRLRDDKSLQSRVLVAQSDVDMLMPADIGDYTDFYASVHHATNIGSMFRPDNPLLPNYKHLPIGYHGRASSIVISGTPVRRPYGQTRPDDDQPPVFGPCKLLDYELEMGFFTGPGNQLGTRITMADVAKHIFGMVIVNDWSARDVQKWEYQPLGPFNAKNFATTISPWVVTLDALAPFRIPGPPRAKDDPPIQDYLKPVDDLGLDITVEVHLMSKKMREQNLTPFQVSHGTFEDMYWTIGQMLAHHTSTGCNVRPGDLMASGTVSGTTEDSRGCLLERTWRGTKPLHLPDGTERKLLQDGDEVIISAWCERDGFTRIGFGECRGIIQPAQ